MFTLNGKEIKNSLSSYNVTKLREVVIDEIDPIIKQLDSEGDEGLAYIRKIKKKTKAGAWLYANGDEAMMYGGLAGGIVATIFSGGGAAPLIPVIGGVANTASNLTGTSTNEKQVLKNTELKIKQYEKMKENASDRGVVETEIINGISNNYIYIFIFILLGGVLVYVLKQK